MVQQYFGTMLTLCGALDWYGPTLSHQHALGWAFLKNCPSPMTGGLRDSRDSSRDAVQRPHLPRQLLDSRHIINDIE